MFSLVKSPSIFKPVVQNVRTTYWYCRTGYRDVVGHGVNGIACYKDDCHFPFPSVRFKENTPDICALREKERCDWRMLCCEEKKALYRASFCQTFSEFQAPTGQWKFIMGWVFVTTSFAFWASMFYHFYVYEPLPSSLSKESQKAQLRRMLELRVNPIDGISSLWDYDNDKWKVAIVLALIGMSLANPVPSGLGHLAYSSQLISPLVEARSSYINHGITLPRIPIITPIIKAPIITPIITPIIKTPILTPIIKTPILTPIISTVWGGHGHGYH